MLKWEQNWQKQGDLEGCLTQKAAHRFAIRAVEDPLSVFEERSEVELRCDGC